MAFNDNFEQTLKDFFFTHHPRKSKLIPQMVKEFAGSEREIMMLLCKKYKVRPSTIDGLSSSTPAPAVITETVTEDSSNDSNAVIDEPIVEKKEVIAEVPEEDSNDNEEEEK